LFPFAEVVALFVFRNKLGTTFVKDRMGAIYSGTNWQREWINCTFKPIMLFRRLLFIALPVMFYNYEFF